MQRDEKKERESSSQHFYCESVSISQVSSYLPNSQSQLMQPSPWISKWVRKDLMDKHCFENSFVAVSLGLYSGFCSVSALGRELHFCVPSFVCP